MEPYLNRMSALANTQSGCGSSRKNLYQPNQTPSTTTTAITPSHVMILRRRCATRCALSMDCSLQLIERHQTVRFGWDHPSFVASHSNGVPQCLGPLCVLCLCSKMSSDTPPVHPFPQRSTQSRSACLHARRYRYPAR